MSTSALSKRTVVLIGSSGSGKSTIANKIYGREVFHQTNNYQGAIDHDIVRKKCESVPERKLLLEIHLMDSGRLPSRTLSRTSETHLFSEERPVTPLEHTKQFYRDNLPDNISLIIFVCKYKSPPSLESLKRVVGYFDGTNGRAVCALVVTNCEGLSLDEKKSEEEKYRIDREKAFIGDRMKRIICVGFNRNEERANKKEEQASIDNILSLVTRSNLSYTKDSLLSQSFCEKATSACNIL